MAAPHSRSVAQGRCQNRANFYHRAPEKSMDTGMDARGCHISTSQTRKYTMRANLGKPIGERSIGSVSRGENPD